MKTFFIGVFLIITTFGYSNFIAARIILQIEDKIEGIPPEFGINKDESLLICLEDKQEFYAPETKKKSNYYKRYKYTVESYFYGKYEYVESFEKVNTVDYPDTIVNRYCFHIKEDYFSNDSGQPFPRTNGNNTETYSGVVYYLLMEDRKEHKVYDFMGKCPAAVLKVLPGYFTQLEQLRVSNQK